MARTPRYTVAQMEEALTTGGGFLTSAAAALACSVTTIKNYMEKYPALREVIHAQKEAALDMAEGKLLEAINRGDAWAICFLLKTQGRKRGYSERAAVELTGADGSPLVAPMPQSNVVIYLPDNGRDDCTQPRGELPPDLR